MLRIFVAIVPPPDLIEAFSVLEEELSDSALEVRWTLPDALHLTVQFLGDVAEGEIPTVKRALRDAVADQAPFDGEFRGMGVFPNQKKPRVLWVGLESPELIELAGRIEVSLSPVGFPPAEREFRPHLTLGRIRSAKGGEGVTRVVREISDRNFGTARFDRLILFKSDLRQAGSIYTPLTTFEL